MARIDPDVFALQEDLVFYRRKMHANPEASLKEFETSCMVKEELGKAEIPFMPVGETGLLGEIVGQYPGKTIFLRADMDALELEDLKNVPYASKNAGLCHACGHDAHTAALLGAARILKARSSKLHGRVKLCFQQAEEIGQGAKQFVEAGHLDDVDLAFAMHTASYMPSGKVSVQPGPRYASCDIFTIQVHGKSSHVGRPNEGADAALASAHILIALQNLASRQTSPFDPLVIGIGKIEAGSRYNIVASKGHLEGTLRCYKEDLRQGHLQKIEEIAQSIAKIHGCSASFENYPAADAVINDTKATSYAKKRVLERIGKENLMEIPMTMSAEDFADYGKKTRAVFINVGTGKNEKTTYPHHSNYFDLDEDQLVLMTQLHVDMAMHMDLFGKEE